VLELQTPIIVFLLSINKPYIKDLDTSLIKFGFSEYNIIRTAKALLLPLINGYCIPRKNIGTNLK